ncbi:hypothetical protein [Cellulosimicrobium sp. 4261]|uniref:hypothetical protein n=1 Tax=Cellulosimicrobium sp. 4261 TaxID=3156458 RepID=UPI00339286B1
MHRSPWQSSRSAWSSPRRRARARRARTTPYNCGTRDAKITASAPTNVSLTANGATKSARNSAGAAVTLYDYDGQGTAYATSTDASVAIHVSCF